MKIETQVLENHQVKLQVEATPDELAEAKQKAARAIARRIKIPGFRPGKAPYNVIERQVGEGAIIEDALEILAQELYPKALDEADIKPYGPGSLENIPAMDPPTFEFLVPLEAEVNLGDYEGVRLPYEPGEITENEVEETLTQLREQHAVISPVERSAQQGDLLRILLSGERLNPEEGQETSLINERSLPVIIEKDLEPSSEEWPFPGFSRQLIGLKAGDEITLEHTFSDESPYEILRGTEAKFMVKVEQVSERILPELNDEFTLEVSDKDTLDELRAEIRKELAENKLIEYHRDYDDQVIETIVAASEIKYPPQMVDREVDDMLHDLEHRLEHQGLNLELYLKLNKKDEQTLRDELKEDAEKRLRRSLVLFEIARAASIEVPEQEVQQETINTLASLSQSLPEEEMKKITSRDSLQNLVSNIMADLLVRKTVEYTRAIASENKSVPPEEEKTGEELEAESEDLQLVQATHEDADKPEPAADTDVKNVIDENAGEPETQPNN